MKKIALLGSTGSIGRTALRVVDHLSKELQIVGLAVHSSISLLEEQVLKYQPKIVAIFDETKAYEFQKRMPKIAVVSGREGLCEVASYGDADMVVLAMSGTEGVEPALKAIEAKKEIAIANKELLVCAGELVMRKSKEFGVNLVPIDSEHCAILQCLEKHSQASIRRLILTASGGPFRDYSEAQLEMVTPREALSHPNWLMGRKISVDSSTLMNKGLEIIEACFLFSVHPQKIDVVIHPESVIHSMVEFCDGSILAQMSYPDMVLPIQYALTYPKREYGMLPQFDFTKQQKLTFESPDRAKFPCLRLAEQALIMGKSMPCFLNAANEVLVHRFLAGECSWKEIPKKLEQLMSFHTPIDMLTLESIHSIDIEARNRARRF